MHQERTRVRSYFLPASRSLWRQQSGRWHVPKRGDEPHSSFQWVLNGGFDLWGVHLQMFCSNFSKPLQNKLLQIQTPHVQAKLRKSALPAGNYKAKSWWCCGRKAKLSRHLASKVKHINVGNLCLHWQPQNCETNLRCPFCFALGPPHL